jgi:hypothetical protein
MITANFGSGTQNHDVAVTSVKSTKTVVGQGYGTIVKVTVQNQGNSPETFTVSLYANNQLISIQTVTSLVSGTTKIITFQWLTTGWSKGTYALKAVASVVLGETDTADNTLAGVTVLVSIPGDLNGDKSVDSTDLLMLARDLINVVFGKPWNPNSDINNDGYCNFNDLSILLSNYGRRW